MSRRSKRQKKQAPAQQGYRFGPGWNDVTPGFVDEQYKQGANAARVAANGGQFDGGKRGGTASASSRGATAPGRSRGAGQPNPGKFMGKPNPGKKSIPQADGGKRGRPVGGPIAQADLGKRSLPGTPGNSGTRQLTGIHAGANPRTHAAGGYGREVTVGGGVRKRRTTAP